MIVRAPRPPSRYTIVSNETICDPRLTWAARGLLIHLLSKPDHWRVSVAHLQSETSQSRAPSGRDAVYALLGELEQRGYIIRQQARADGGRMGAVEYVVHETPQAPLTAQPDTANPQSMGVSPLPAQPDTANPPLVSTDNTASTEKVLKTIAPSASRATPQALALPLTQDDICAAIEAAAAGKRVKVPQDDSPIVIELPINSTAATGVAVPVRESVATALQRMYPGVNVKLELRGYLDWANRKPKKRKTVTGLLESLSYWMANEQNNPRGNNAQTYHPQHQGPVRLSAAGQAAAAHIASGLPRAYSLDDLDPAAEREAANARQREIARGFRS